MRRKSVKVLDKIFALFGDDDYLRKVDQELEPDSNREGPEDHLNRRIWAIMRRIFLLVCFLLLIQLPILVAQKVDLRNYVIAGYDATPNEIRLAQRRVHVYWQKNGARFGDKTHYLAFEAASVMPGYVIQPLWQNMINAQAGSGFLLPSAWNPGAVRTSVTLMGQDIGNTVTVLVHDLILSSAN